MLIRRLVFGIASFAMALVGLCLSFVFDVAQVLAWPLLGLVWLCAVASAVALAQLAFED